MYLHERIYFTYICDLQFSSWPSILSFQWFSFVNIKWTLNTNNKNSFCALVWCFYFFLFPLSCKFVVEFAWRGDCSWHILIWGTFNLFPNIWQPLAVWPLYYVTLYKPGRYWDHHWPWQRSFMMFLLKYGCCLFWQVFLLLVFYCNIFFITFKSAQVIVCRSRYFILVCVSINIVHVITMSCISCIVLCSGLSINIV
jgi:hypothetical protein